MPETLPPTSDLLALRYFQLANLFDREQLEAVLEQPQWAAKYPEVLARWRSPDKLQASRVLVPGEIVLAIARECPCIGDFYAEANGGPTLYIATHRQRPFRLRANAAGQMMPEELTDATWLTTEEAFLNYGADAVWLAQEYGSSQRFEREARFRNL